MKHGILCIVVMGWGLVSAGPALAQSWLPRHLLPPADTVGLGRVLGRPGFYHLDGAGQPVTKPLDLSQKNVFSLPDLQRLLQAVMLPETVPVRQRPRLSAHEQLPLREALSQLPPQRRSPRYDSLHYPGTYAKFLLDGSGTARLPPGVRVYNKIGQAYGFLVDNAYVVDAAHGIEFLLAAVVYVNADGVLNADKYEYDTVGLPFLRELGRRVYEAELRQAPVNGR